MTPERFRKMRKQILKNWIAIVGAYFSIFLLSRAIGSFFGVVYQ